MNQQNSNITIPRIDDGKMWNLISPIIGYPAMLVAHNLKFFSLLNKNPLSLSEIAKATKIETRPAKAILNVCVAMELMKLEDDIYTLTPLAEDYLLEDSHTYFGGFLDLIINNYSSYSFETLKKSVLTNSPCAYGDEEVFPSHEEQIELARNFTHAMHGHSMGAALVWPEKVDLSEHKIMLDIAGGSGAHSIGATLKYPSLQAIILDMPPVCDVAKEYVDRYALSDRIQTHASDMWEDPFPTADLHFYSLIYHDWPPEKGHYLSQKSFESLPSGGRIMIHEMLYDEKMGPLAIAAYNIPMLSWMQGQGYSSQDLSEMLESAGFIDIETKKTFGYWSVVMGRKP